MSAALSMPPPLKLKRNPFWIICVSWRNYGLLFGLLRLAALAHLLITTFDGFTVIVFKVGFQSRRLAVRAWLDLAEFLLARIVVADRVFEVGIDRAVVDFVDYVDMAWRAFELGQVEAFEFFGRERLRAPMLQHQPETLIVVD